MPESGRSRPVTIDRVVVLPAPFGPTKPKNEPRLHRRGRCASTAHGVAEALAEPGDGQRDGSGIGGRRLPRSADGRLLGRRRCFGLTMASKLGLGDGLGTRLGNRLRDRGRLLGSGHRSRRPVLIGPVRRLGSAARRGGGRRSPARAERVEAFAPRRPGADSTADSSTTRIAARWLATDRRCRADERCSESRRERPRMPDPRRAADAFDGPRRASGGTTASGFHDSTTYQARQGVSPTQIPQATASITKRERNAELRLTFAKSIDRSQEAQWGVGRTSGRIAMNSRLDLTIIRLADDL